MAGTAKTHNEPVRTTTNHPWLTADHGWLPAGFMHLGEPVLRADGTMATVVAIHVVPGAARMWDLTVATTHTFAVGNAQAVVHNCGDTIQTFDELTSKLDKDKEVVVVGRWMSRVDRMKGQLEDAGFKVRTYKIRKAANVDNNYHWLWNWGKGGQVVDIGMPSTLAKDDFGDFYGMERQMLSKWEGEGNVSRFRYNFGN